MKKFRLHTLNVQVEKTTNANVILEDNIWILRPSEVGLSRGWGQLWHEVSRCITLMWSYIICAFALIKESGARSTCQGFSFFFFSFYEQVLNQERFWTNAGNVSMQRRNKGLRGGIFMLADPFMIVRQEAFVGKWVLMVGLFEQKGTFEKKKCYKLTCIWSYEPQFQEACSPMGSKSPSLQGFPPVLTS